MSFDRDLRRMIAQARTAGKTPTHWLAGPAWFERFLGAVNRDGLPSNFSNDTTYMGYPLVVDRDRGDVILLRDGPVPNPNRERALHAEIFQLDRRRLAAFRELEELRSRRFVERSTIISSNGEGGEGVDRPKTAV